MEIPVRVAVRIIPNSEGVHIVFPDKTKQHILVGSNLFPVTYPTICGCTQKQFYEDIVQPFMDAFLDGYDVSFITYGQRKTGKTYCLYGHGFELDSESGDGIIQRFVRDVFIQLTNYSERAFAINIGWIEICNEKVTDLLGSGNIFCSNIDDLFHWMHVGFDNRGSENCHSIFTLTIEQQWISGGLIQHRLSTISFSDLCGTERYLNSDISNPSSIPKDIHLQMLEKVITMLTDSTYKNNIPYNKNTLTALLKDSFGGRAQTLIILCVSPLERDKTETIDNLQLVYKTQFIKNFVIMNTFSDNNMRMPSEFCLNGIKGTNEIKELKIQYIASQWLKLVENAEALFTNLKKYKNLSSLDQKQIEEWIILKKECEICLSSTDAKFQIKKAAERISEVAEHEVNTSEHSALMQNSDSEDDSAFQRDLISSLEENVENLMYKFEHVTDTLIRTKYVGYRTSEDYISCLSDTIKIPLSIEVRRNSVQPGTKLSMAELVRLNKAANREKTKKLDLCKLPNVNHSVKRSRIQQMLVKSKNVMTAIDTMKRQIKDLENAISRKQKLIDDLLKYSHIGVFSKQSNNKKKCELDLDYGSTKAELTKPINGHDDSEIKCLEMLTEHLEKKLQDLISAKNLSNENRQQIKILQQSLIESKKDVDKLKKKKKRLEKKLQFCFQTPKTETDDYFHDNTKNIVKYIDGLDNVQQEKTWCHSYDYKSNSLRHEIRSLRRIRDQLLEQRCVLRSKFKKDKSLTQTEERKLLESDETIEAIDTAIEFKNELICGRNSVDSTQSQKHELGQKLLITRLNKLTLEEMRAILYKYFSKVIDLRISSHKLEMQLLDFERERDTWKWRERILNRAIRRLELERKTILLQRQQETKLTLMLRHLADETNICSHFYETCSQPILENSFGEKNIKSYNQFVKSEKKSLQTVDINKSTNNEFSNLKTFAMLNTLDEANDMESKSNKIKMISGTIGNNKSDVERLTISCIPAGNRKKLNSNSQTTGAIVTRQKNKIIIQNPMR